MIEIIILYMLIGCVIGLVTWILDAFIPCNCYPLTGKNSNINCHFMAKCFVDMDKNICRSY